MRGDRHVRISATALATAALGMLLTGCHFGSSSASPQPKPAMTQLKAPSGRGAKPGVGGCGRVYPANTRLPWWTRSADPPTGIPWVSAAGGKMVGVLFGQPFLAAPRQDGRTNKILWISRVPRNGQPLEISATRVSDGKTVNTLEPADAGPGEIYPSIVDVPGLGCWRLNLAWGSNRGWVDVYYGS